MVGSSEASFNNKALIEGSHEMGSKLRATIGEDFPWNSVEVEHIGVVDVSGTLSCKVRLAGHEVALIWVVVDIYADGIKAVRSGKLCD
jgi:hypothetical protein